MKPLLLALAIAAAGRLVAQEGEPAPVAKPAQEGRQVGGPVAFVRDGFAAPLVDCLVSDDGSTVVVLCADEMVHFLKLSGLLAAGAKDADKTKDKGEHAFRYRIDAFCLTPDGGRLVGRVGRDQLALVTQQPMIGVCRGMPGLVSAAIHPDGKRLVAGMEHGLVRIWDADACKPLTYMPMNDKDLTWVGFAGAESMMTATKDKKLRFFTFPGGLLQREVPLARAIDYPVVFGPERTRMVLLAGDRVDLWDPAMMASVRELATGGKDVVRATLSGDGRSLAAIHADGTAVLLDVESGKRRRLWSAHPGKQPVCLRYARHGERELLVTASKGGDVVVWDVKELLAEVAPAGKKKAAPKKR